MWQRHFWQWKQQGLRSRSHLQTSTGAESPLWSVAIALVILLGLGLPGRRLKAQSPIETQNHQLPIANPKRPGTTLLLEARLYLPARGAPLPVAIINHGSPRDGERRRKMNSKGYQTTSRWFLERGFAVLILMRRGYGSSQGEFSESFGPCKRPNYVKAGKATAYDILSATRWLQERPFADRDRILLVGQSAGGWGTLAAISQNPAGVVGAINFAGGRGSLANNRNCSTTNLIQAAETFGTTARIPSLWIYTENDRYFWPGLSQQLFAAFNPTRSPNHQFKLLPAFGNDGHRLFASRAGLFHWEPHVEAFLSSLPGLQRQRQTQQPGRDPASACNLTLSNGSVIRSPLLCDP